MIKTETYNLVKALRKGDIASFDRLFDLYHKKVYLFARGILKSHEDAEYIVQEVFIKIWEKRNKLDEQLSFESYIFTISYNTSISLVRKKLKERSFINAWQKRMENETLVVNEVYYKDLSDRVEKLIEKLPPRRKQVFLMSREDGITYKEISERLGISVNTVENHVAASLKFLRDHLEETLAVALFFALFL